jgi:hypothetical protein
MLGTGRATIGTVELWEMNPEAHRGTEVLRVQSPEEFPQLDDWIHDAYLEDALQFSAETARAVVPFAQESGWGSLHPSMPDPVLIRRTLFSRHYRVPLTRCYLVVEHAKSLDADVDWGIPMLNVAHFDGRQSILTLADVGVPIAVSELDIRVLVSSEVAGHLHRKVLRGWPMESDRWVESI